MSSITEIPQPLAPAYLIIGSHEASFEKTKALLQNSLCLDKGCMNCIICKQINEEQHHSILWLTPEKEHYTLEQLEIIHSTIAYKLADREHYFIVIQKAERLSTTCANSLLKSIEEPPAGYHFILLAERIEFILPTIRSRCQVEMLYNSPSNTTKQSLLKFFIEKNNDPLSFLKELELSKIGEQESIQLLNKVFYYWIETSKNAVKNNNQEEYKKSAAIIKIVNQLFLKLPMPGSSKLFLKNLFLQIQSKIST